MIDRVILSILNIEVKLFYKGSKPYPMYLRVITFNFSVDLLRMVVLLPSQFP